MEVLVVGLLVVVIWLLVRGRGGTGNLRGSPEAAASARRAVEEADEMCLNAWKKLAAFIEDADLRGEGDELCVALATGKRLAVPSEVGELWRYIDDISARSNTRAEHYELVSGLAAPTSRARAYSDALFREIRKRAAAHAEEMKPEAKKATSKKDDPKAAGDARALASGPPTSDDECQDEDASPMNAWERDTVLPAVSGGAQFAGSVFLYFFAVVSEGILQDVCGAGAVRVDDAVEEMIDLLKRKVPRDEAAKVLSVMTRSRLRRFVRAWSGELRFSAVQCINACAERGIQTDDLVKEGRRKLIAHNAFRAQVDEVVDDATFGKDVDRALTVPGSIALEMVRACKGRSTSEWSGWMRDGLERAEAGRSPTL